jgi:hypothetical protein
MLGALLRPVDRAAENIHQPFLTHGLFEKEERPCLPRFDRAGDRPLATDDDDFWRGIDFLQPPQQRDPVEVRKHEVGHNDVRPPLFKDFLATRADEGRPNLVPFGFDDHLQPLGHRGLVVDRKDALAAFAAGRRLTCHASLILDLAAGKDPGYVRKSYRDRVIELKPYRL